MEFSNDLITVFLPAWLLLLSGFLVAFVITYRSIPPIIDLARLKGFYDMPNGRTSHMHATPYLGGVAVFTGLILSTVIIAGIGFEHDLMYIIAGLVILLFIGLKDDMLMINPMKKLMGQITASGIIIVLGDIRIENFHGMFGIEGIPYLASLAFTIFVFIVIINGINLIDGIDGLASGLGIIIAVTLGIWFFTAGFINYAVMSFALAGSLIAFFYFNVFSNSNKIFLGDAGSLMIGLMISVFIIRFLNYQRISLEYNIDSAPAFAFGILIIPFFDTLRVFMLRIFQGRSPFSADRQHIHHILLDIGLSHFKATLALTATNLMIILLSFGLQKFGNIQLISLQLLIVFSLSYLASWILRKKREKDRLTEYQGRVGKQISLLDSSSKKSYSYKEKNFGKQKKKFQFLKILNV
jgi:UDP-N-acetylmuramyl pentapeptide phosphotransferase/UDP-N-acetylglucosamine-1-phosphate transferase